MVLVFEALLRGPMAKPVKVRVNTNLSREMVKGNSGVLSLCIKVEEREWVEGQ